MGCALWKGRGGGVWGAALGTWCAWCSGSAALHTGRPAAGGAWLWGAHVGAGCVRYAYPNRPPHSSALPLGPGPPILSAVPVSSALCGYTPRPCFLLVFGTA